MTTSGYQIVVSIPPDGAPVTLAEAKKQCKVDEDIIEEDDLIQSYIDTATELAEDYCHRSFMERTLAVTFDDFPRDYFYADNRLFLPMGPVIEIESFGYKAALDGAATPFTTDQYQLGVEDERAYLVAAYGTCWPGVRCGFAGVTAVYRAGYASQGSPADASGVPRKALQAIRMLIAHFYNNRESVVAETRIIPVDMAYSFERLLDPLKIYP